MLAYYYNLAFFNLVNALMGAWRKPKEEGFPKEGDV